MRVAILSEYPGYVISDDGRVQGPSRKWLNGTPDEDGYLRIWPYLPGGQVNARVHILVCTAFHGDRPSPRHQVRHLNGRQTDNRADNLAWGTAADNGADRVRHGTTLRAERHSLAKLTWPEVREIRRRYAFGCVSQAALGREYRVAQVQIHNIVTGKTWIDPEVTE